MVRLSHREGKGEEGRGKGEGKGERKWIAVINGYYGYDTLDKR